ncbi:MAG UNVERIFIED_CONTAM: hypothetical protein LVR18_24835 [Planctomycetaceae bacterium]
MWAIGTHYNQPLTGILSADITTVQAPACGSAGRSAMCRAGDEVFTGQPLLQLENTGNLDEDRRDHAAAADDRAGAAAAGSSGGN